MGLSVARPATCITSLASLSTQPSSELQRVHVAAASSINHFLACVEWRVITTTREVHCHRDRPFCRVLAVESYRAHVKPIGNMSGERQVGDVLHSVEIRQDIAINRPDLWSLSSLRRLFQCCRAIGCVP